MSRAQIERALQTEIIMRLRAGAWPVANSKRVWLPARSKAERALTARLIARMKAAGLLST